MTNQTEAAMFVHEKDVAEAKGGPGVGAFKWSFDSRRIAYVNWSRGTVSIVDVDTGAKVDVPGSHMPGVDRLAWTLDGNAIAISSGSLLKVIQISDGRLLGEIDSTKISDWRFSFGKQLVFSRDGTKLLFEVDGDSIWLPSTPERDRVLLGSYDLKSGKVTPILRTPILGHGSSGVMIDSGRFHWHDNKLMFSVGVYRSDALRLPDHVIGDVKYGHVHRPVTCFIFDLSNHEAGLFSQRSIEFPPPGDKIEPDGSNVVLQCRYSPIENMLVVSREKIGPAPRYEKKPTFYEAIELGNSRKSVRFPSDASSAAVSGTNKLEYELNPAFPLLLVSAEGRDPHELAMSIWSFESGKALDRIGVREYLYRPAFSPDGLRVAVAPRSGDRIALFKISDPKKVPISKKE